MSGGILLGTFLLGDWEEIKFNRDLRTLLCWWKHNANEKPFRRGCCLCIMCWMRAAHEWAGLMCDGPGAWVRCPRPVGRNQPGSHQRAPQGSSVLGWAPALRSLSLQHQSKLLQLLHSEVDFLRHRRVVTGGCRNWDQEQPCVYLRGVLTLSLFIFMGCCGNWVKMRLKKYRSPDPAMYLCTLCSLLHFLVFFCFNKAKRISPSSQSCQCCP